jgi:hypothetical protein
MLLLGQEIAIFKKRLKVYFGPAGFSPAGPVAINLAETKKAFIGQRGSANGRQGNRA